MSANNGDAVTEPVAATTTAKATTTMTETTTSKKTDQNEIFSLQVKKGYVLTERDPSLPELRNTDGANGGGTTTGDPRDRGGGDDRDGHGRGGSRRKTKRNSRKERKRLRQVINASNAAADGNELPKLCLSVIHGGGSACPFGDKCRFSHDLDEYMRLRPQDIQPSNDVLPPSSDETIQLPPFDLQCPHYFLYGHCRFGVTCRLGSIHINKQGQNVDKDIVTEPPTVANTLRNEVQEQLRKNKYPFKCQRYDNHGNNNNNNNNNNNKYNNKHNKSSNKSQQNSKDQNEEEEKHEKEEDEKDKQQYDRSTTKGENDLRDKKENRSTESEMDVPKTKVIDIKAPNTVTSAVTGTTTITTTASYEPLPTKERKLIDFSKKVYVAPLTTLGNLPFRRIVKQYGADITCGEMALCSKLLQGHASEWALLKRHHTEDMFGVQIAGGYPDQFTRTAELIQNETDLGHCNIDFVDLNLGCPIDLLCQKGGGAALMMREKRLKDSLVGITQALTTIPITIKMRTGWDITKNFAHVLTPKIVHKFDLPTGSVAAIMLHGRSRLQRYNNTADWDYIQQVGQTMAGVQEEQGFTGSTKSSTIPLIGNGDIFSYTDYEEKVLSRSPDISSCAMLGRGALIKPWLPTEIKERRHWDISASERLDMMKDFVKFGLEHWGSDQQGVNNTRRFLLEWMSFLHRYIPVWMLEVLPQQMNHRPPNFMRGRNDLETLLLSNNSSDWIKISEMLLGPVPDGYFFEPKHKAKSYQAEG